MSPRRAIVSALMLLFVLVPAAGAAPSTDARSEIDHLLAVVNDSGCEFNRNGAWYDSKMAHAHLRNKYEYLLVINVVSTAEDFIEKVATDSSFSGQPYEMRCDGGPAMASGPWLYRELARFREHGMTPR